MATLLLLFLIYDPTLSIFEKTPDNQVAIVDEDKIENGIHLRTGLKDAKGLMTVVNNCTNCHSAKLVIQNRMNKERWDATIRWMQETQNLWDLGENQQIIVDYLVTNYPVLEKSRRENLANITWYEIND
ncbi:monoheme cytochrome C [Flavobacteriaceae bacterium S356]|uniref:Monoheme cytochrome C n=2 Tax=Asprobacillus argus TaxID=3076534 RepID=A0ABU3LHQ4_9FLAO|nr:monoheme cytochrome C [Flavobacteriaceae bacterium S356]